MAINRTFQQRLLHGATAVALQGGRRILAAGIVGTQFALAGFRPSGALDSSFGLNEGLTTLSPLIRGGFANAIALQRDGKIVLAGEIGDAGKWNFAVARFDHEGDFCTRP